MAALTARKSIRVPLQALGLSLVLAGTVLAASGAGIVASPVARDASIVPAPPRFVGGMPHQVAPLEGGDDAVLNASIIPAPSRFVGGMPHQVAPVEGPDDADLNASIVPTPPRFVGGMPHQVAPLEGGDG